VTRRIAFVTGASRGIGRAAAIALAERGFDVVATARTVVEGETADGRPLPGSLVTTAGEIRERGREALPIRLDLLDPATLEPLAERRLADRDLGADFLTNFAGGGYAVLDREGRLVLGTADGTVELFTIGNGRGGLEIMPLEKYDVSATLADSEPITSVLPDAGGDLFYVGAEDLVWGESGRGNRWGDYLGWDQDGDGIGDRPYRVNGLEASLLYRFPGVVLLLRSPALEILFHMAERLPVLRVPTIVDVSPVITRGDGAS